MIAKNFKRSKSVAYRGMRSSNIPKMGSLGNSDSSKNESE